MENIRLPDPNNLVISSSPHLSCRSDVRRIMLLVILSLAPACIAGIWFFGMKACVLLLCSVFFCILAEAIWCLLRGKSVLRTITDGSAALTGVLLALNLPPSAPWYLPLIGSILAIWLGKQIYGGLGRNPFNPVLVARVGLLIALPAAMTSWTQPRELPEIVCESSSQAKLTSATPLGEVSLSKAKKGGYRFSEIDNPAMLWRYFCGEKGGSLGETCVPALLMGFIILVVFNLINYRVPLCFVGTVFVMTAIIHWISPDTTPGPLFHVLTGGLLLGAIFMATDMVTSPITGLGCIVFAVGCGIITTVIRVWGNYPEGVSFSILIMNALVPLIDRMCAVRPFGYVRKRG